MDRINIFTRMTSLANELAAVNLAQGFPHAEPPRSLKEALADVAVKGYHQYFPAFGDPSLRQTIAQDLSRTLATSIDAETDVTVVPGATYGILVALLAVCRRDDEVILLEPAYDSYLPGIRMAGASPVPVDLAPDFSVDWDRVRDALTPRTRAILLNTPHNPSGRVLDAEDIAQLAAIVDRTGIHVLSDEVYDHVVFSPFRHVSPLSNETIRQRGVLISSFGKTFSVTGWKIGFCFAEAALTASLRYVHQYAAFATNGPGQGSLAKYLREGDPSVYLKERLEDYTERRDQLAAILSGCGLEITEPQGTIFMLARLSESCNFTDEELALDLVRSGGVATIPLSAFYEDRRTTQTLRFCFARGSELLVQAGERMSQWRKSLPKGSIGGVTR